MPTQFEVEFTRVLRLKVYGASWEEVEQAAQSVAEAGLPKLRPGPWKVTGLLPRDREVTEAELRPQDYVVHRGGIVRYDTLDTRTIPMPFMNPPDPK
jgi:hypothetical protein